jgi:hypothetical protein
MNFGDAVPLFVSPFPLSPSSLSLSSSETPPSSSRSLSVRPLEVCSTVSDSPCLALRLFLLLPARSVYWSQPLFLFLPTPSYLWKCRRAHRRNRRPEPEPAPSRPDFNDWLYPVQHPPRPRNVLLRWRSHLPRIYLQGHCCSDVCSCLVGPLFG